MRKVVKLVVAIVAIGIITVSCGRREPDELPAENMPPEEPAPVMAVSQDIHEKLKSGKTVALLVSGNEPLLLEIIKDHIAINLRNAGFSVSNPETIEKSLAEEVAKRTNEQTPAVLGTTDLGKAVNADYVLIGTIIVDRADDRGISVQAASFRIVDVQTGEPLLCFILESEPFLDVARRVVEVVKRNMGPPQKEPSR